MTPVHVYYLYLYFYFYFYFIDEPVNDRTKPALRRPYLSISISRAKERETIFSLFSRQNGRGAARVAIRQSVYYVAGVAAGLNVFLCSKAYRL